MSNLAESESMSNFVIESYRVGWLIFPFEFTNSNLFQRDYLELKEIKKKIREKRQIVFTKPGPRKFGNFEPCQGYWELENHEPVQIDGSADHVVSSDLELYDFEWPYNPPFMKFISETVIRWNREWELRYFLNGNGDLRKPKLKMQ